MMGSRTDGSLWIRRFTPAAPGAVTVACLPHAGGSASFYLPMARALSPGLDVMAIQYPGRQDRRKEKRLESIAELADHFFPVLLAATNGPMTLFGHSMGATLAFELARRLEQAGIVPRALFVSARPAPSRHRKGGTVHLSTDDELVNRLRFLSGTHEDLLGDDELLRLALPAVRSDYKAAETYLYRPGPKLRCPVHAIIGDADEMVTVDEANAWGEHTEGPFALHTLSGGHFYLVEHQAAVLRIITEGLTT